MAIFEISTTATFDRLFRALPRIIQRKAASKTGIFRENPFHPSLRTEKLHPKHHEVWSFRVDRSYRIIFKFTGPDQAELRYIGHHQSIYHYDLF
ncbi:MAG: type II toxin-antitoxin system RelE/ParE family toxin [Nitrospirae bacterium]|nr:type II toxin-antitoxin system RelE/ParE family toxin [Nitrospirota bacterium]